MGAAVVVEVLIPIPLDGSVRRRAAERVREAKSLIADGKHEEAVVKARLALDPVREITKPNVPLQTIKAQDRTQLQRWSIVVESLYSLASGAGHDDAVTEDFTWSRADAVAVLSATAGLLRRLGN